MLELAWYTPLMNLTWTPGKDVLLHLNLQRYLALLDKWGPVRIHAALFVVKFPVFPQSTLEPALHGAEEWSSKARKRERQTNGAKLFTVRSWSGRSVCPGNQQSALGSRVCRRKPCGVCFKRLPFVYLTSCCLAPVRLNNASSTEEVAKSQPGYVFTDAWKQGRLDASVTLCSYRIYLRLTEKAKFF